MDWWRWSLQVFVFSLACNWGKIIKHTSNIIFHKGHVFFFVLGIVTVRMGAGFLFMTTRWYFYFSFLLGLWGRGLVSSSIWRQDDIFELFFMHIHQLGFYLLMGLLGLSYLFILLERCVNVFAGVYWVKMWCRVDAWWQVEAWYLYLLVVLWTFVLVVLVWVLAISGVFFR